jgi:hypothetical protein
MYYSIIAGEWLALLLTHIQEVLGSNHMIVLMTDVIHGFLQSFQSRYYLSQDHNNLFCLLFYNSSEGRNHAVEATERVVDKH